MTAGQPTPTDADILAALNRTGYIFEQRVAALFGDKASTGWSFQDQDTGTSREVDIFYSRSVHSFGKGQLPVDLSWTVLGECKNYQWPWVALTKPWPDIRYFWELDQASTSLGAKIRLDVASPIGAHSRAVFSTIYSERRFQSQNRAIQLVKLNKKSGGWEAHAGDIFNDITYPLAKATSYLDQRFSRQVNEHEYASARSVVQILFPAIFVSSPIYLVAAGQGQPEVRQANHAILERRLSSESVSGLFRFDVVNVDGIREWYNDYVLHVVNAFAEKLDIDPTDAAFEPLQ
nr:hypothetical protein [Micromonospora purpureochromogenes]